MRWFKRGSLEKKKKRKRISTKYMCRALSRVKIGEIAGTVTYKSENISPEG